MLPLLPGKGEKAFQHGDRLAVLEVLREAVRVQPQVPVAKAAKDFTHTVQPEQGRIELHEGVEPFLGEQIRADRLDLAGRAAVHRGERHGA